MTTAWVALGAMLKAGDWSDKIAGFRGYAIGVEGARVVAQKRGSAIDLRVVNDSAHPVTLHEVVIFDAPHELPPSTPFYGEGLTMLSQYGGSFEHPIDYGQYQDRSHYRQPEPPGFRRVYGVATFAPAGAERVLIGFGSANRFVGSIDVNATRIRITEDLEGIEVAPKHEVPLEPIVVAQSASREALFDLLTAELAKHHSPVRYPAPPSGWCSWYCFGPRVTAANVRSNADVMSREFPQLKFVQVDDGYQPAMGDWLDTGPGFGGVPIATICHEITAKGLRPAIWVAPFIAERGSNLFKSHPDWFVKNGAGQPLDSSTVMFGGWRRGPWYVLDGTHPGAQDYLERVFRTMRREWGVTYFKLDANYWGMAPGGHYFDAKATRIEAYRRGMQAVRRGAGADAYLLGCNHPIWPSLGLIDGSRSSMDIERTWNSVASTGRENLLRAWQNGRFWWNDPDCLVLSGDMSDSLRKFHATVIAATGGAMFSGDDLTKLTDSAKPMLAALMTPSKVAARFDDDQLEIGRIGERRWALFNWSDQPATRTIQVQKAEQVRDIWTGELLQTHDGRVEILLAPRSARWIEAL